MVKFKRVCAGYYTSVCKRYMISRSWDEPGMWLLEDKEADGEVARIASARTKKELVKYVNYE
jgi:hypothetical protein